MDEDRALHPSGLSTPAEQLSSLLLVAAIPPQRARQHMVTPAAGGFFPGSALDDGQCALFWRYGDLVGR